MRKDDLRSTLAQGLLRCAVLQFWYKRDQISVYHVSLLEKCMWYNPEVKSESEQ